MVNQNNLAVFLVIFPLDAVGRFPSILTKSHRQEVEKQPSGFFDNFPFMHCEAISKHLDEIANRNNARTL
jgi:hypothetical protein